MAREADMGGDRRRSARRWPLWLAGGFAAVSILAMLVAMIGWQQAEQAADDQAAQVASVRADADQLAEDRRAAEQQATATSEEIEMLRALLEPGTPAVLEGVYLQLIQVGCADAATEVDDAIAEVAQGVSADSPLSGHPNWPQALDREAVAEALANCETDGENDE